jgi:hypothetical protein
MSQLDFNLIGDHVMRPWGPAKIEVLGSRCEPQSSQLKKIGVEIFPQNKFKLSIFRMPSPAHLISKVGDPIFAAVIGLSAAATRINREEKELGHTTQQTINAGLRYAWEPLSFRHRTRN